MCGIAGVYALTDRPPDPEWGTLLTRALRHRGPDGEGVYADSRVVLAHTRLAIIDVTDAGRQPMHSADGSHVILLNGEIYNHGEIRSRLEAEEGVVFRSRSDTEVLLEALARRGRAALDPIIGMFAFALYERGSGSLLLGRDRLGKKPLLYCKTSEWFAFASEAAALLQLPFLRARVDPSALRDYMRHLYVPAPATLIEGMRKLPAASTLSLRAPRSGPSDAAVIEPYWRLPRARDGASPDRSRVELDRALDSLLLDATLRRTVSDVPIGVFLSGGVDSNTILESLWRVGHRPIRAFTVGFEGLPDERPVAREGARRYADEHVEIEIRPDFAEEIPRILRHFGEPLGDSAIATTYLIAREASRHVKVVLNGDGGDELFGGYARYPFARRLDLAASLPGGLKLARALYGGRPYLRPVFEALDRGEPRVAARRLTAFLTPSQENGLLGRALSEDGEGRSEDRDFGSRGSEGDAGRGAPPGGLTAALFEWDTLAYLPDDLLVKVDLASMAHGLENRSPFLDHRLFEAVAPLPPSIRTHPLRTKPIGRRLASRRVPREVLRARKQGFQLPLETWLRGPLAPWLDDLLSGADATRPLYREGALDSELARFRGGTRDPLAPYRLWGLAVLELWAREFQVEMPG